MMRRVRRLDLRQERGAALVITALAMVAALAMAALAIDSAIWYVHSRHLQTQADAAAFAGADQMAVGFENNNCTDSSISSAVHQYDGSGQTAPAYNQQVPSPNPQLSYATNYSNSSHNLFSLVNQKNFENQSIPADTGLTGDPCGDATVDVKMTESNLPSFISVFKPPFINKQAEIRAETVLEGSSSPFVLPNILTPSDVAVFVVSGADKSPSFSSDSVLAQLPNCADNSNVSPCLTGSNSGADWVASGLSVPFNASTASLVVAKSSASFTSAAVNAVTTGAQLAAFCATANTTCYDQTDGVGLTYTRTYTAGTSTFPTGAPIIQDTALSDSSATATPACESAGSTGLFTGFMTSSTTCKLNFSAGINFGTESCSDLSTNLNATLTITASSGGSSTLTCPGGNSSTAGSASGYWQSATPISVAASAGPITFDLTWSRAGGGSTTLKESWESGGVTTGSKIGQCTNSSPCTKDFNIVQRAFTGAYDQNSAATSNSGTVAGAALTSAGAELFATPANTTVNNLGVAIDFQALTDASAASGGFVPNGSFTDIAYGTNQGNGLADCGQGVNNGNGSNGFDVQQNAVAGLIVCNNFPIEPSTFTSSNCTSALCPGTVPGNKFLQWIDAGLAYRVYGCPEVMHSTQNNEQNGCTSNPLSVATCAAHPNYWDSQNKVSDLEANTSDPRLLTIMVTDPGSLANGNHEVPVRHYAEFYVTGWSDDPCSGVNDTGQSSNGLYYTTDDVAPTDAAGDMFLVGHFLKDFTQGSTGSGQTCVESQIDNCTLTVTK